MNFLKPFLEHQGQVSARRLATSEEECFSCGTRFDATWEHYREWKDCGEDQKGFFCDDCIEKRKDRLL